MDSFSLSGRKNAEQRVVWQITFDYKRIIWKLCRRMVSVWICVYKLSRNAIACLHKKSVKCTSYSIQPQEPFPTRMHSSRMRTGRTLTVFRWRPPRKNWRPPENLEDPPKNWTTPQKFGGTPLKIWRNPPENLEEPPLWTEWMTDACENITLAKTSFRPVTSISGTEQGGCY